MGHRKRPALHIPFGSFDILDPIEIWANRRGEKIIPWARQALIRQARAENYDEIMSRAAQYAALEALLLLRATASPQAAQRALDGLENFKQEAKTNVSKQF